MRVFSTFSGISAATAAWRGLGWTVAGYAEYDPYACAVLAARCGATKPRYHPTDDPDLIGDEHWDLVRRIDRNLPKGQLPLRLLGLLKPGTDPQGIALGLRERLHMTDEEMRGLLTLKEREDRERLLELRRRTHYEAEGTTPNFGDLRYMDDQDLEELGPVDLLEGGSPCHAFSAAGRKAGLLDHRSATLFGFVELVERMKRINGLKWVLWENVKGVLNDTQNGFGYLLGRIVDPEGPPVAAPGGRYANAGYVSGPHGDVAWRLLDAQHFGQPMRRERVFALARVGPGAAGADPREILFDEEGEGGGPEGRGRAGQAADGVPGDGPRTLGGHQGPIAFMAGQSGKARSCAESASVIPTLRSKPSGSNQVPSVAYLLPAVEGKEHSPGSPEPERIVVRRLLPSECERLMGFPEGWTAVEVNGRVMSDTARYQCLGNSMSVDVMKWIGGRLDGAVKRRNAEAA